MEFIGYDNSVFNQLVLPNLEYLSMQNLGSLESIINSLFNYPKLEHLFIYEIKFYRLSDMFLNRLQELKKARPTLTFDFETTKYQTISENMINGTYDLDEEGFVDELYDILDREQKASKKFWSRLQSIFNLADLKIDEDGYAHLSQHQYLPEQWMIDNGYFVKKICEQ